MKRSYDVYSYLMGRDGIMRRESITLIGMVDAKRRRGTKARYFLSSKKNPPKNVSYEGVR